MVSRKYFGTDGIRGAVGGDLINEPFARAVGVALARWLKSGLQCQHPRVLIGRDTRQSGLSLCRAIASGLAAEGVTAIDAGIAPTPAVARAIPQLGVDLGVVITASHNPASDNGIKLFCSKATKLSDDVEAKIEQFIDEAWDQSWIAGELASVQSFNAANAYCEQILKLMPSGLLKGLRIACDTANGATCCTTPYILRQLGAEVHTIGDKPDGRNINQGVGSEHPEQLSNFVIETGAQIGIAHDGDGDRLILVDETGKTVEGDEVLAMAALHLLKHGLLAKNTVVATIMSNMGLDAVMAAHGAHVIRVGVGDRYVAQSILQNGYNFGGETSGHIIFRDFSTTGDGLMAALQILQLMVDSQQPLSELRKVMRFFPQYRRNLRVQEKIPFEAMNGFLDKLQEIESNLGSHGRVLVRYSGTETKIRILSESENPTVASQTLQSIESLVRHYLSVID